VTRSIPERTNATLRSALAGLAGAALYGIWAFYINRDHGTDVALSAALTQAFVSFSITFAITRMIEGVSGLVEHSLARFVVPAVGGIGLAAAYTLGLHSWMGTPEVLQTAAPSLIVGSAYCCLYSAALARRGTIRSDDVRSSACHDREFISRRISAPI
jgi:hypothetical protein